MREKEKTEEIHNPFGSTNCIRFLGYNLSHRVAPLCLYGGKVSEKENKKKVNRGLFHRGVMRNLFSPFLKTHHKKTQSNTETILSC